MCRSAGLSGSVDLRTYLYLSDAEKAAGRLSKRQAVIQCADPSSAPHASLKHWRKEGYQGVVDLFRGDLDFVQLGSTTDSPLDGVIDLRGKTTIRQSAAILANSRVNIGYAGFLMHLARAVECRSVVIFGGREHPDQSGYIANENLFTPLPCSPCWRRHDCLRELECLTRISPGDVVAAARRVLALGGEPLPVGRAQVPDAPVPFILPWQNLPEVGDH
jgi:ADP-heptose:LPS heptosyltransferase